METLPLKLVLFEDPEASERLNHLGVEVFSEAEHPAFGRIRLPRTPGRFSGTPTNEQEGNARIPLQAEHTEEVLTELLALSEEEVRGLVEKGAVAVRRPIPEARPKL